MIHARKLRKILYFQASKGHFLWLYSKKSISDIPALQISMNYMHLDTFSVTLTTLNF